MSQMKLDLISIGGQLPDSFLSSFINRLSPTTYVRLRRTCSSINQLADEAIDRKEIHVMAKNRGIRLGIYGPNRFCAYYCKNVDVQFNDTCMEQVDTPASIFDFSYRDIYLYYDNSEKSAEELREYNEYVKTILERTRCDTLHLGGSVDIEKILQFLPAITCSSLEISPGPDGDQMIDFHSFMKPEFERFPRLSVECSLSPNANFMNLFKYREFLELKFVEKWNEVHPLLSQFIKDILDDNFDLDLTVIKKLKIQSEKDPDQDADVDQVIGPDFTSLLPGRIYYAETVTRKVLLFADEFSFLHVDMAIMHSDDLPTFVDILGEFLREDIFKYFSSTNAIIPLDNSYLYSLLEAIPSAQYGSVVQKYAMRLCNLVEETEIYTDYSEDGDAT